MPNCDYAKFLPFKLKQINVWEIEFLSAIQFDLNVDVKEFTKVSNLVE